MIDIDLAPSKRELVFEKIREERGQLGCVQVCTYGSISTKAAIKVSCRGYRSQEHPDGIDLDEAEYISSLVPSERGFLWNLSDCFYGNKEKEEIRKKRKDTAELRLYRVATSNAFAI